MFLLHPKGLLCVFRGGKRAGKNGGIPVLSEIIPVEPDGGSVRIFKALLRLKGAAQDIAGVIPSRKSFRAAARLVFSTVFPPFSVSSTFTLVFSSTRFLFSCLHYIFEQIKKLKPEQVDVLQGMLNQMK